MSKRMDVEAYTKHGWTESDMAAWRSAQAACLSRTGKTMADCPKALLLPSELEIKRRRDAVKAAIARERYPERFKACSRAYYANNPHKFKRGSLSPEAIQHRKNLEKKYRQANLDKLRARERAWDAKNKDKKRAYYTARNKDPAVKAVRAEKARLLRATNPAERILHSCRQRVRSCLGKKDQTTISLIGCTPDQLKAHLESKFKDGMSWENYGKRGWHIDHILPCASFNMEIEEERNRCFHYANLQPLWAMENILKRDKILAQ